jgi:hypothetical protein
MRQQQQQQQQGMNGDMMQLQQQQHMQQMAGSDGFPSCGQMSMQGGYQHGMNMMNGPMNMQHSPNPMNLSQSGVMGAEGGMGFQPGAMSTPCMQRPQQPGPMQGGQGYGPMPPGWDYAMSGRPPANMEGVMYGPHPQQPPQPQQHALLTPAGPGSWQAAPASPHVMPNPMVGHSGMKPPPPHPGMVPGQGPHQHHPGMGAPLAPGQPHSGPCSGNTSCPGCKLRTASQPGPASKAFSSQQKFLQHLILDNNSAYRSHPLYPLLRDLVIAGMNFDEPKFHYQQLLSMLPHDFEKLLQNFLHRNPPSGQYRSNYSVESVLMDSLRLAHGNLVGKLLPLLLLRSMGCTSNCENEGCGLNKFFFVTPELFC